MIRIASQEDVNTFFAAAMIDPSVSRFLGVCTYVKPYNVSEGTWNGITLIDDSGKCLGRVHVDRTCRNDCSISIYTLKPEKNKILSGKMMYSVRVAAQSFDPKFVKSVVLVTNVASMAITKRLLGKPWGIEPDSGWDSGICKWVDIAHFRCPIGDI